MLDKNSADQAAIQAFHYTSACGGGHTCVEVRVCVEARGQHRCLPPSLSTSSPETGPLAGPDCTDLSTATSDPPASTLPIEMTDTLLRPDIYLVI